MYHRLTPEQIQEVLEAVDRSAGTVTHERRPKSDHWLAVRAKLRVRSQANGEPMSKMQAAALRREQARRDREDEEFDAGPVLRNHLDGQDDPGPDEIAALTALIRESWSEAERQTRETVRPIPWNMQTVKLAEMRPR